MYGWLAHFLSLVDAGLLQQPLVLLFGLCDHVAAVRSLVFPAVHHCQTLSTDEFVVWTLLFGIELFDLAGLQESARRR